MIERLTGSDAKLYRRCLCSLIMWYLWYYSLAFTELMIDLPCLMYYVFLINAALKIYRGGARPVSYLWIGFLSGLCMTASGQYSLPAVCILVFVLWATVRRILQKALWMKLVVYLLPLVVCLCSVLLFNKNFENTVVEPLREEGEWIPTDNDWLESGLVRFKDSYRTGGNAVTIPSYRIRAILGDYYGEAEAEITRMTVEEYISLFFTYPADFVVSYLNSFFLILSPDGGELNFWPLFIFYTLLYLSLYIGLKKCNTWRKLFSPLFWIGFSFLWAIVPMIVMNIEARNCLQIQGLVIALALCDDTVWKNLGTVWEGLKEVVRKKGKLSCRISYPVIFYMIFIIMCFVHISTLYEMIGPDPGAILIGFG